MGNYDKYKTSNYIQKTDIGRGILVTISHVEEKDVSMNDQPDEMKYVVHFMEDYKPWVPGISMLDMIHHIAQDTNTDHWGKEYRLEHNLPPVQITMYVDDTVQYRGKIVGGIRCRAPKAGYVAPEPEPPVDDSDVPF
jgi:hypothetical protein